MGRKVLAHFTAIFLFSGIERDYVATFRQNPDLITDGRCQTDRLQYLIKWLILQNGSGKTVVLDFFIGEYQGNVIPPFQISGNFTQRFVPEYQFALPPCLVRAGIYHGQLG